MMAARENVCGEAVTKDRRGGVEARTVAPAATMRERGRSSGGER
ncbi:hypothetical protein A2U01_0028129 [Trifolium medium]|uniref:Uncharacterized protein n=1 Tax=Trifolium medium TaxID=97028 RepID=A0A392P749_9FABA|nr:hypothetical protein [Trifolium medium]